MILYVDTSGHKVFHYLYEDKWYIFDWGLKSSTNQWRCAGVVEFNMIGWKTKIMPWGRQWEHVRPTNRLEFLLITGQAFEVPDECCR